MSGIPHNYRAASNLDGYTNSMLADACTLWHGLPRAQKDALVGARPIQGVRVVCSDVHKQTADALVARGFVEASSMRFHRITGLGVMVREAGVYTREPSP